MVDDRFFDPMVIKCLVSHYNVCARDWQETRCSYAYNKFYYFMGGEGRIVIGNDHFYPKPGELFLIPGGTTHSYSHNPDNPVKKYWCHFEMGLGEDKKIVYTKDTLKCSIDPVKIEPVFQRLVKSGSEQGIISQLEEKSAILRLLIEFFCHIDFINLLYGDSEGIQKRIDTYIQAHIQDEINLRNLSQLIPLHPNYFITFFKKRFGVTPIQYVQAFRLKEATKLLSSKTPRSIYDIAYKVGFQDYRYFSRLFKRKYGLSPKAYREI